MNSAPGIGGSYSAAFFDKNDYLKLPHVPEYTFLKKDDFSLSFKIYIYKHQNTSTNCPIFLKGNTPKKGGIEGRSPGVFIDQKSGRIIFSVGIKGKSGKDGNVAIVTSIGHI